MVLLALVAKPTSDSVASQSVSAEYSTSIEVLNIRNATIQNFQYRNPDPNATINSRISDASASAESKRDVFEFLVQMRQSIEVCKVYSTIIVKMISYYVLDIVYSLDWTNWIKQSV